ncbi:MAG: uroporphyrinogen decarboxylase family protein [Armatimonadota bacterium]
MTPRQRLFARLQGKPVDRAPNLSILMLFAAKYIGCPFDQFSQDYRKLVEANLRCNADFGIDLLNTMSDAYRETYDYGAKVTFPYDSLPVCTDPLLKETSDLAKLPAFDPWQSTRILDRIRAVELYKQTAGDEYPILGWVEGPIAEMADLRGLTQTLIDFYESPEFVREVFAFLTEQAIRCAQAQIDAGADIIGIGDAAASVLSPDLYREQVLPFEQQLIAAIHQSGALVKLHICGEITHLLDDIGKTGADIIDVDWMVRIPEALARCPGAIINGNFDPVAVMLQGTPADVKQAARRNLEEGGDRLCVAPGCEVPRDTPHENLKALDEALWEAAAR